MEQKPFKSSNCEKAVVVGDLTYSASKELLNLVSGIHNRFNGLIMMELQMIQNFDKVVRFDLDDIVTYYNIEIHK